MGGGSDQKPILRSLSTHPRWPGEPGPAVAVPGSSPTEPSWRPRLEVPACQRPNGVFRDINELPPDGGVGDRNR